MNLSLTIARRYLFSKKSHSAINSISVISVCGVALITMALVCVLSIYNGFQEIVESLYSTLDAEIKVTPLKGKTMDASLPVWEQVQEWSEVQQLSPILQENALLVYRDRQTPALLKGVPDNYSSMISIDSVLLDGEFKLTDEIVSYANMGIGVANRLGTGARFSYPIEVYAPQRTATVNLANPSSSFTIDRLFMASVFSVSQPEYDDQLVILPIDYVRKLYGYTTEVSSIELKLAPNANERDVIKRLKKVLGDDYVVKNRMQQQESAFNMMQIEKWITFLIMLFILMIATFNVVGSISMLIIDKQNDITTLRNLGADNRLIVRIFVFQGYLISIIGAGLGIFLGIVLCFIQQTYGVVSLGAGGNQFIVDAYPVQMQWGDLFVILFAVTTLGLLASWYPVKQLTSPIIRN